MNTCYFPTSGNYAYKSIKAHGTASAFEPGIIDKSRHPGQADILRSVSMTVPLTAGDDQNSIVGYLPIGCRIVSSTVTVNLPVDPSLNVTVYLSSGALPPTVILAPTDLDSGEPTAGLGTFSVPVPLAPALITSSNSQVNAAFVGNVPISISGPQSTITVDFILLCP
jgi:hypothetical protein